MRMGKFDVGSYESVRVAVGRREVTAKPYVSSFKASCSRTGSTGNGRTQGEEEENIFTAGGKKAA